MELRINDYVRYRCAYDNTIKINKINAIVSPDNLIEENYYKFDDYEGTIEKCIIKSSPDIIDLIEVGDYVNGVIVTQSYIDNIKHIAPEIKENNYGIKSIVTKEQFEV